MVMADITRKVSHRTGESGKVSGALQRLRKRELISNQMKIGMCQDGGPRYGYLPWELNVRDRGLNVDV